MLEAAYHEQKSLVQTMILRYGIEFNKKFFPKGGIDVLMKCPLIWQDETIRSHVMKSTPLRVKLYGMIRGKCHEEVELKLNSLKKNSVISIEQVFLGAIMSGSVQMLQICMAKYQPNQHMEEINIAVKNAIIDLHRENHSWFVYPEQRKPICTVLASIPDLIGHDKQIQGSIEFLGYFDKMYYDVYVAIFHMNMNVPPCMIMGGRV